MSRYHYTGPAIDHGLLSPSGRMSQRAREAATAREAARLFPPGTLTPPPVTEAEARAAEMATLRRSAATLRDLAARGMSRVRFTREAAKLEEQANALEEHRP